MNVISTFYHYIYDAQYEALQNDEEYQAAWNQRNTLEKDLVMSLTRKQRVLFHQYRDQQEALTKIELHRLFAQCSILLTARGK